MSRPVLLLSAVALALSPSAASGAATASHHHRPLALVYKGPGGCAGCSGPIAKLLRKAPQHFRVRYVGLRDLSPATLRHAVVYAQPGGNGTVQHAAKVFGPRRMATIRQYVRNGGHYLGFCMGAYLAASDPGIGLLLPGNSGQYIATRGASVHSTRDAIIPVVWNGHRRMQFEQDGPYLIASHVRGERILARYTNGRIDALVRPYGKGGVGVVGTHPEATYPWYTQRLLHQDSDGYDHAEAQQLVRATLRF